jgi:hypothetical protein
MWHRERASDDDRARARQTDASSEPSTSGKFCFSPRTLLLGLAERQSKVERRAEPRSARAVASRSAPALRTNLPPGHLIPAGRRHEGMRDRANELPRVIHRRTPRPAAAVAKQRKCTATKRMLGTRPGRQQPNAKRVAVEVTGRSRDPEIDLTPPIENAVANVATRTAITRNRLVARRRQRNSCQKHGADHRHSLTGQITETSGGARHAPPAQPRRPAPPPQRVRAGSERGDAHPHPRDGPAVPRRCALPVRASRRDRSETLRTGGVAMASAVH